MNVNSLGIALFSSVISNVEVPSKPELDQSNNNHNQTKTNIKNENNHIKNNNNNNHDDGDGDDESNLIVWSDDVNQVLRKSINNEEGFFIFYS